jgi:hypothetical protein
VYNTKMAYLCTVTIKLKEDYLLQQSVIPVSHVVLLHVHQPRALASAAVMGSLAHDPSESAVGDHEGISKPLSSCIYI